MRLVVKVLVLLPLVAGFAPPPSLLSSRAVVLRRVQPVASARGEDSLFSYDDATLDTMVPPSGLDLNAVMIPCVTTDEGCDLAAGAGLVPDAVHVPQSPAMIAYMNTGEDLAAGAGIVPDGVTGLEVQRLPTGVALDHEVAGDPCFWDSECMVFDSLVAS